MSDDIDKEIEDTEEEIKHRSRLIRHYTARILQSRQAISYLNEDIEELEYEIILLKRRKNENISKKNIV
jgi:hypothetical protein